MNQYPAQQQHQHTLYGRISFRKEHSPPTQLPHYNYTTTTHHASRIMNDEPNNNPLLCLEGRTKLQDGERLVRGQAICHTLVEHQQQQPGSLTTSATDTTTTTTIWAFGLDWCGHPIFYRSITQQQQQSPSDGNDSEPQMTVLWQENTTTVSGGDYLALEGTTGQLVLMVDHDNADEEPPPPQPVWGIGGCGQLDGSDLALYQLTISEDRVSLGIIGSSEGTLWSLDVQEEQGQVILRDECPPWDQLLLGSSTTKNSNASENLDNDGLQNGGMVGLVLGAAVLGILLGMWARQKYPSSCRWCTGFSPTNDQKDGEKDPQGDRTNSSSTTMDSPNRQTLEVPEVTL
mmetsp:Transcript_13553/g.26009  ORF Transcript_13553/g.26009 Transcript_13553/m.26009 type:complete len:345 (-) Transcript_13553:197-1231(-)